MKDKLIIVSRIQEEIKTITKKKTNSPSATVSPAHTFNSKAETGVKL